MYTLFVYYEPLKRALKTNTLSRLAYTGFTQLREGTKKQNVFKEEFSTRIPQHSTCSTDSKWSWTYASQPETQEKSEGALQDGGHADDETQFQHIPVRSEHKTSASSGARLSVMGELRARIMLTRELKIR